MKTFTLSSLAIVATVAARPFPEDIAPPKDAFNFGSAMDVVNALAEGNMASLMGGDKATEQFTNMARMLGAGPGRVGEMSNIIKTAFNSKSLEPMYLADGVRWLWQSRTGCK
jgi:hypothetical protein